MEQGKVLYFNLSHSYGISRAAVQNSSSKIATGIGKRYALALVTRIGIASDLTCYLTNAM
jgi:hypothetical protein